MVAHGIREGPVVGHDHDDRSPVRLFTYDGGKPLRARPVEPCRRLVEKKEQWLVYERPRQGDALSLAPRVRPDGPVREADEIESFRCPRHCPPYVGSVKTGGELDVLSPREVRIAEGFVPDPAEGASHHGPRPSKDSVVHGAGARARQRADERQQRRLPGPVRPPYDVDRPAFEPARHANERPDGPKGLGHMAKLDDGWHVGSPA